MTFARKAAFEHFRRTLALNRKPLPQKGVDPIRDRLEKALESDPSIIVEKVHYTSHTESLLEFVCTWVGLEAGQEAVISAYKTIWNTQILAAEEELVLLDPQDDLVYLLFAGAMPDDRFITGKVLVRA